MADRTCYGFLERTVAALPATVRFTNHDVHKWLTGAGFGDMLWVEDVDGLVDHFMNLPISNGLATRTSRYHYTRTNKQEMD